MINVLDDLFRNCVQIVQIKEYVFQKEEMYTCIFWFIFSPRLLDHGMHILLSYLVIVLKVLSIYFIYCSVLDWCARNIQTVESPQGVVNVIWKLAV